MMILFQFSSISNQNKYPFGQAALLGPSGGAGQGVLTAASAGQGLTSAFGPWGDNYGTTAFGPAAAAAAEGAEEEKGEEAEVVEVEVLSLSP